MGSQPRLLPFPLPRIAQGEDFGVGEDFWILHHAPGGVEWMDE